MRLLNHIDRVEPRLLYIMPEVMVEGTFESFRAFKRERISLYETEEEKKMHWKEFDMVYTSTGQTSWA